MLNCAFVPLLEREQASVGAHTRYQLPFFGRPRAASTGRPPAVGGDQASALAKILRSHASND